MSDALKRHNEELQKELTELRQRLATFEQTDVARITAEEALRAAERRFSQYVDNAPVAIFVANKAGRFIDVNPAACRMTGYRAEELRMLSMVDLAPRESERPSGSQQLNTVRETGTGQGEFPILRKDGGLLWFSMRAVLLERGRVLAFCRDVTERRQAEEKASRLEAQILQSQKLESLGVLAGGIAHEFNNLLMSMLGNVELALLELPESATTRDFILGIEAAAQRAAVITNQMLAYSGRGRFIVDRVSLSDAVQGTLSGLTLPSGSAALRMELDPRTAPVEADLDQVRQLVTNLVTNAAEAIDGSPGTITVSTGAVAQGDEGPEATPILDERPEGACTYLEVADTGCGMDATTRDRMFEPFFSTKFTGRGLGLAAVLGIARGHHAAIQVLSAPGRGTTVRVLFPVATTAPR